MGAKFWFAVYSEGPATGHLKTARQADKAASLALAAQLFPGRAPEELEPGTLDLADPRGREVLVGVFPGLTVVAAETLAIDQPSKIHHRFIEHGKAGRMTLHLQHSVVDWTAFALWEKGILQRSLSVSSDGIAEDIGERLPFEQGFWEPQDPYNPEAGAFYGHPLELGEEALLHFLGFQYEGDPSKWVVDPEGISLPAFRVAGEKPFWKFW